MTELDLPALKKLCEAATPGPDLKCNKCLGTGEFLDANKSIGSPFPCYRICHCIKNQSKELDEKIRTALPQLIEEVEYWRNINRKRVEKAAEYANRCSGGNEYQLKVFAFEAGATWGQSKENAALKAEKETWGNEFTAVHTVKLENQALRSEVEKLKAHFEGCSADKIVELRQELGARHVEIRKLQYTLDQGKGDLAEIRKLRELLGEMKNFIHCELGRGSNCVCPESKILQRIDAALLSSTKEQEEK